LLLGLSVTMGKMAKRRFSRRLRAFEDLLFKIEKHARRCVFGSISMM